MSQVADLETEFERAWAQPGHTRAELPPVDVNQVLAEHYVTDEPLSLTRTQLWDLEVRKSSSPGAFIPYVVQAGSDSAWTADGGPLGDRFVRQSQQLLWLDQSSYGLVLEDVALNHQRQAVTFIGLAETTGPDGTPLKADTGQPLFHVEHAVGGTESSPLNTWRIVLLTDRPDDRFVQYFAELGAGPWLPGFVEIYIRDVLGIPLTRKR